MRDGKDAVMIMHDLGGWQAWPVSVFKVSEVEQFKRLGPVIYVDEENQGQQDGPWTRHAITLGHSYCTVERDGEVPYDSRNDLPVKMKRLNAARRREIRAALAAANGTPPSDELIRAEEERLQASAKAISRPEDR